MPTVVEGVALYAKWGTSMLVYVVIVCGFAVLINTGVLVDKPAYATVVVLLNVFLFAANKCGVNAEPVRIGLTRAYLAAERLDRIRAGVGQTGPSPARSTPAIPTWPQQRHGISP
ncbi:hypothetical protein AB0H83_47255 [Dactylosporangium sp. NPDC050688]|uniref:hypothetical protein n=1 Tax=Dactylosporangium sp. NPDC050688 TaxID=3157217 RepID=UPI0034009EE1